MNRKFSFIFNMLCAQTGVLIFGFLALASDFQSPRTIALGGASHASPLLNDAIYLNPAFTAFLPNYGMGFFYQPYGDKSNQPTHPYGHIINASLQDGHAELFQAGVGYTRREDATFIHVGAGKAASTELGFGFGAKFFFRNTSGSTKNMGRDLTFSTQYIPLSWLQTAVVVDNILEAPEGKALGLKREYILGTKVNILGTLIVYGDPHYLPTAPKGSRWGYEAGVEHPLFTDLFVRFGMFRNSMIPETSTYGRGLGMGLGWIAPKLSLDYGFKRNLGNMSFNTHSLGFTVFF